MSLDVQERLLIEQRITNDGKSMILAYVFWFFLGLFGAHRFYLGRIGSAVIMLILSITLVGMIITGVWWLIDAFLIPEIVAEENEKLRQKLAAQLLSGTMPGGMGAAKF